MEENRKAEIKEDIEIAILEIQSELQAQKDPKDLTNSNVIEDLPNKIKDIIINDDMTGEHKGYEYYIDEEYKVHIGAKTTNPIKVKITPTYIGTSSCTIEVEATSTKGDITGYQYKINDKSTEQLTQSKYTIEDLEPNTKYNIFVIIVDDKGNTKTSMPITITTKERTYIIKDGVEKIAGQVENATKTQEDGYLKLSVKSTTARGGYYFTYDLTNYNKVKIDAEVISKGSACGVSVLIFLSNPQNSTTYYGSGSARLGLVNETKGERGIYSRGIENLQGNYILTCWKNKTTSGTSAVVYIYNLWLEE